MKKMLEALEDVLGRETYLGRGDDDLIDSIPFLTVGELRAGVNIARRLLMGCEGDRALSMDEMVYMLREKHHSIFSITFHALTLSPIWTCVVVFSSGEMPAYGNGSSPESAMRNVLENVGIL